MYTLRVDSGFAAAHQLREYKGKCENLHGHNWRVTVRVRGENLDRAGMLMDFGDLKRLLEACLDRFDHRHLNELPRFAAVNPTSENLARCIFRDMAGQLPPGVAMASVAVWESDACAAVYEET